MPRHAPHVSPGQARNLLQSQPGQSAQRDHGQQGSECCPLAGFEQGAQFFGRVKFYVAEVLRFFRHAVGDKQAMIRRQIVALDSPFQEHFHRVAPAVARAGRNFTMPVDIDGQVLPAQIADRVTGKGVRKFTQPHGDDVVPAGGQLRAFAVLRDCPQFPAFNELLDGGIQFNPPDRDHVGQESVNRLGQRAPVQFLDGLGVFAGDSQERYAAACGAVEFRESFNRGQRVAGLRGVQGVRLRPIGKLSDDTLGFCFGFAVGAEISDMPFASGVVGQPVIRTRRAFAVDRRLEAAVFDALWEFHGSLRFRLKTRRILCQTCVTRANGFVLAIGRIFIFANVFKAN